MIQNEIIRCRKWIEDALEYSQGTHDFADIVDGLLSGHMQLWPAENSCLVTEIVVYPKKKVLHVFLAGGNLDEILDMEQSLKEWGIMQGCSNMTMAGRKGWTKVLTKSGWQPSFTVMSRGMTDE